MSRNKLPLLLEPAQLVTELETANLLLVDLSSSESYKTYHIPGAVHLECDELMLASCEPGSLTEDAALQKALNNIGLTEQHHVIAYDDSDSGRACRLLWTLDLLGHSNYSLLNGGLQAWIDEHHPVESEERTPAFSEATMACSNNSPKVDLLYVLQHLNKKGTTLVDARTPDEYSGAELRAQRGGHIPGAINLPHNQLLDPERSNRLRTKDELEKIVKSAGINPKDELIVYCHSHRRSALVYFVLNHLGYKNVKAYAGSWAEWGNNLDTPVE